MMGGLYTKLEAALSSILDALEKRGIMRKLKFSEDRPLVLSFYLSLGALIGTFMPTNSPLIIVRWVTLLPFFFAVPGYSIIRIVYPKEMEPEERFILSIITSIAIMPLAGLSLMLGELGLTVAVVVTCLTSITLQLLAIREKYGKLI